MFILELRACGKNVNNAGEYPKWRKSPIDIPTPLKTRAIVRMHPGGRRAIAVKNALDNRTTTVYDAAGQPVALVDARSNRHSFTYDATGRQTRVIDPLGRRTTLGYKMRQVRTRDAPMRGVTAQRSFMMMWVN